MRSTLSTCALLAICLAAVGPARAGDERVLLWRLKSLGVDAQVADRVSDLLAKEMDRIDGVALVPAAELRAAIEAAPELGRCAGQLECLLALGRATSARRVVSGVLGELGDTFSLDLKLVDVGAGRESDRLVQTWGGSDDSLIEVMRQVATRALKPDRYLGRLNLSTNVAGVKVFVDGDYVGRTPLSGPVGLAPGRHALKLVRKDYHDHEQFVDLVFDRELPMHVELEDARLREVVAARPRSEWLGLGIRAGALANWRDLVAPVVGLDVDLRLPFWDGRLAVQVSSAVYGQRRRETAATEALGEIPVRGELLVWPVSAGLVLRTRPWADLSPYLAAGGCFFLVWQTLSPEGYPSQTYRDPAWGFTAAAGLEYRLGPGALALDLAYLHLDLPRRNDGGFSGLLGGLSAGVGYRFLL